VDPGSTLWRCTVSSQNADLSEIKCRISLLFTPGARWYRLGKKIREAQLSGDISTLAGEEK
jgi:hypothetical protein